MDILISNIEYALLIINFLPDELSTFISQLSATAKLAACLQGAPVMPTTNNRSPILAVPVLDVETLMELVLEEWDHHQGMMGEAKAKDTGVAASAVVSEKPTWKGCRGPQRPVGVCWNCRGKGHRKDQCPSPNLDAMNNKDSSSSSSKPDALLQKAAIAAAATTASATVPPLDDVAGAWSAFITANVADSTSSSSDDDACLWSSDDDAHSDYTALTEESDHDSLPSLRTESDSDSDAMPLPRVLLVEDPITPEPLSMLLSMEACLAAVCLWIDDVDGDVDIHAAGSAIAAANTIAPIQSADLYDSGASHHMSPYQEDFLTFCEILLQTLSSAN
ncbi:hypothetical protein POSPLADRAFT_1060034 [Postia placenta MAD-698-R-SB12]|uniref:CCHC-type domain-containing protein n=1 Tax=Postia placenta MAD-698-R-SB12 TaxID=670580 RepID=A0A1X6MRT5_9APHY|nr:hypothetical protein POSPLADRAFT_1060034 [Postia placenta MAD-698-R-SB12]OSX58946.1 hypothetical protein POSPLADRAFT_1060034 [Postia placenta MAD-698-R-SB12]